VDSAQAPTASPGTALARAKKSGKGARVQRREQTHRERVQTFIEAYKKSGDLTASMLAARLSRGQAKELVETHPELREDVCMTLARGGVTPARVIQEISRIALCDPREMFDAGGRMRPINEWPEDVARAVSGVDATQRTTERGEDSVETETTYKPRFWDKPAMLKELVRMLRLVAPDQLEVGAGVVNVNRIEVVIVPPGRAGDAGPAGLV
jgi:hypothetical protein